MEGPQPSQRKKVEWAYRGWGMGVYTYTDMGSYQQITTLLFVVIVVLWFGWKQGDVFSIPEHTVSAGGGKHSD